MAVAAGGGVDQTADGARASHEEATLERRQGTEGMGPDGMS